LGVEGGQPVLEVLVHRVPLGPSLSARTRQ
jgi:hypothetical protein